MLRVFDKDNTVINKSDSRLVAVAWLSPTRQQNLLDHNSLSGLHCVGGCRPARDHRVYTWFSAHHIMSMAHSL